MSEKTETYITAANLTNFMGKNDTLKLLTQLSHILHLQKTECHTGLTLHEGEKMKE